MKKVEVKWRDAHRYTYQMEDAREVDITTISSLGYLVSKDKRRIIISQDDITGDLRGVQAIPRENIISIKLL